MNNLKKKETTLRKREKDQRRGLEASGNALLTLLNTKRANSDGKEGKGNGGEREFGMRRCKRIRLRRGRRERTTQGKEGGKGGKKHVEIRSNRK